MSKVQAKEKWDRRQAFEDIIRSSRMNVKVGRSPLDRKLSRVEIEIFGPAGNIPSVSNNKMLSVHKGRAIGLAKNSQIPHFRNELIKELARLRPQLTTNPKYQVLIDALTALWKSIAEKLSPELTAFDQGTKKIRYRFFVLLLLGDQCTAADSHNVPKAACDWLEDIGLIGNDRNADCLAIRKKHLLSSNLNRTSTTIIVTRAENSTKLLSQLVDSIARTKQAPE